MDEHEHWSYLVDAVCAGCGETDPPYQVMSQRGHIAPTPDGDHRLCGPLHVNGARSTVTILGPFEAV